MSHNGQAFNDGIIPYFAQDVSFTLDQLASLNRRDPQGLLTGTGPLVFHSAVWLPRRRVQQTHASLLA